MIFDKVFGVLFDAINSLEHFLFWRDEECKQCDTSKNDVPKEPPDVPTNK